MEIRDIDTFLHYFTRIHQRTLRVVKYIPEDKLDWSPSDDAFSFSEIIAHIGSINRYMYAENIQGNQSKYHGHSVRGDEGNVVEYYTRCFEETRAVIAQLSTEGLNQKCQTPGKVKITTWKWLRAMIEHEIHHRGQIYLYLKLLGIESPPLYGLTSEEVRNRSLKEEY